jgi:hypothetical protein
MVFPRRRVGRTGEFGAIQYRLTSRTPRQLDLCRERDAPLGSNPAPATSPMSSSMINRSESLAFSPEGTLVNRRIFRLLSMYIGSSAARSQEPGRLAEIL